MLLALSAPSTLAGKPPGKKARLLPKKPLVVAEKVSINIECEGDRGMAHLLREVFEILAFLNPDAHDLQEEDRLLHKVNPKDRVPKF